MAHPELTQPQLLQTRLGLRYSLQGLHRHRHTVRYAGRQARLGWLVPRGQAAPLRENPDILLGKPRLHHRVAYAVLLARLQTRAKVLQVVQVGAAGYPVVALLGGHGLQPGIKLQLAEVASAGVVGDVARVLHLIRLNHPVTQAQLYRCSRGFLQVVRGHAGRRRRHSQAPISKDVVGSSGQECAVDPSGVGHYNRPHFLKDALKHIQLLLQRFASDDHIPLRVFLQVAFQTQDDFSPGPRPRTEPDPSPLQVSRPQRS